MTSSLRNSVHRRNHKERSQLAHRAKLGFLEKHKDYVKRARDYHSKQDRLTRLKQKASERNKDEFYFSMTKEKTKGGVHVKDRGNVALPTDVVKVLKTQDENYVRTMRVSGLKKIDKIKRQLTALADLVNPSVFEDDSEQTSLDAEELEVLKDAGIISSKSRKGKRKQHIVFVEDEETARNYVAPSRSSGLLTSDAKNDEPEQSNLGWIESNEKRRSKKRKTSLAMDEDNGLEGGGNSYEGETSPSEHRQRLLKELSARLIRDKQMRYAEREFEMQRAMMGKGARKKVRGPEKVGGDNSDEEDEDALDARGGRTKRSAPKTDESYKPRVYKWRTERKR